MLTTAYLSPSHLPETAQSLLESPPIERSEFTVPHAVPAYPDAALPPDDHRVRILIYGSVDAITATIAQLHQLRFVEQFRWNPIRAMPDNGIHIPPEHAAYSFLLKPVR